MLRQDHGSLGTCQWGCVRSSMWGAPAGTLILQKTSVASFLLQREGQRSWDTSRFSRLSLEPQGTSRVMLSLWAPRKNSVGPVP